MNVDIRIAIDFWDHPKTVKLERRGGLVAIKCLQILWMWVAKNKPCGKLHGMDNDDIEIAARWSGEPGGFVKMLSDLRWLDKHDDEFFSVHAWKEHNPWVSEAEERANKARLSILFKKNPEKARELREMGVTGLTRDEYNATVVQRSFNGRSTVVNDSLTPSPSPSPTPNVISVGSFSQPTGCEVNETKNNGEDDVLEQAKEIASELAEIVISKKKIKINGTKLNGWASSIRQMVKADGIDPGRIRAALRWYRIHVGDDFVVVIESGKSLREKFLRLEHAMQKESGAATPEDFIKNQEASEAASRWKPPLRDRR